MFTNIFLSLLVFGVCAEDNTSTSNYLPTSSYRITESNVKEAIVKCSTPGNPTPDIICIKWDETVMRDNPRLEQVFLLGHLVFPDFRAEDYRNGSIHICVAKSVRTVAAKILSFNNTFTTQYKKDINLPCRIIGTPPLVITWKFNGVPITTNDKIRQQSDGSLFIRDVNENNEGEYSCFVENHSGQDSVTHQLIVKAPPRAPQVTVTDTTNNSLTLKIKPYESEFKSIRGYTIHYKEEFGEWETMHVGSLVLKHTLEKLLCGTRYQIYVNAYNSVGTGDSSDILFLRTQGKEPISPSAKEFIEVSSNSISLHTSAWSDGDCPIIFFVIEYKMTTNTVWILSSNNVKLNQIFVISDLDPATLYDLRVTAHNNAGFNVAEYEVATLNATDSTT